MNAETSQQTATLIIDQALQQAITYHQAGQIQDAERLYLAILQIQPDHTDVHHNLSLLAEQVKQAIAGLPDFKVALEANPDQGQCWINYIDALILAGQTDDARQILQLAQQHGLQGETVAVLVGRLERIAQLLVQHSIEETRPVTTATSQDRETKRTSTKPDKLTKKTARYKGKNPSTQQKDALVALFAKGRYAEVTTLALKMTVQFPQHDFGWKVLGTVLKQMGQNADALAPLQKAVELSPGDAETHNNLSVTMKDLGRLEEAESSTRRALQLNPYFAEAHNNLGTILHELSHFSEAEASYRLALQLKPDYAGANNNLSITLQELGRLDEAKTSCRHALEVKPDHVPAFITLANILHEMGHLGEAEAGCRQALEIKPDSALAYITLSNILQELGLLDEAVVSCRRALLIQPNYELAFSNLLYVMNYHPDKSDKEVFAVYREYDSRLGLPLQCEWRPHGNSREPLRRLKIGYVSPDFRKHSVQYFLEPLLANHNKQAVEVFAYAELAREDAVTARFKHYVDQWIPTRGMSDAALAERIRADGVDILVDLAGHTGKNRLQVFARKPAPLSVSWLGYGYTTGLSAIDYFLTDTINVPEGSEALYSEAPWRLATPSYTYRPAEGMGEVSALPALTRGYITFGTLTRPVRINHRTIRVWSEILNNLEDSRLVIDSKSFSEKYMQDILVDKFAVHGIARERLEIGYHSPPWDVLRGIDIGLDCFPHNSGTTLFETLYMGIPYIVTPEFATKFVTPEFDPYGDSNKSF